MRGVGELKKSYTAKERTDSGLGLRAMEVPIVKSVTYVRDTGRIKKSYK